MSFYVLNYYCAIFISLNIPRAYEAAQFNNISVFHCTAEHFIFLSFKVMAVFVCDQIFSKSYFCLSFTMLRELGLTEIATLCVLI